MTKRSKKVECSITKVTLEKTKFNAENEARLLFVCSCGEKIFQLVDISGILEWHISKQYFSDDEKRGREIKHENNKKPVV